ncbi:hypothetical protein [Methanoregula sp.]|uniref:hypothetical protein n=1 Tax=Methanoregula sp. TaxID=2052170 RepID=UPI003C7288AC
MRKVSCIPWQYTAKKVDALEKNPGGMKEVPRGSGVGSQPSQRWTSDTGRVRLSYARLHTPGSDESREI